MLVENFSNLINKKYREDKKFDEFLTENKNFQIELEREDDSLIVEENLSRNNLEEILERFEEITRNKALPKDEIEKLIKNKNDENISKLILDSMAEINRIALYFCKKGTEYLELIQEGIMGALKGIERYDFEKGEIKKYLRNWISREISIYIEDRLLQLKGEFKYHLFNSNFEEIKLNEEEKNQKLKKIEEIKIEDIPFTLNNFEIRIMEMYFGLYGEKRFSMYEIEKKLNLGKNTGEEKFYSALKKLSKDIGGMFLI